MREQGSGERVLSGRCPLMYATGAHMVRCDDAMYAQPKDESVGCLRNQMELLSQWWWWCPVHGNAMAKVPRPASGRGFAMALR